MIIGISIIMCCYNSSKRLPSTLAYLANQSVPNSIPWEIVIVDNSSTDNTGHVIDELTAQLDFKCPLRVVVESRPGLSNARKKGLENCNYEYIIFCDDDNWLSPNYVSGAYKILSENPSCGVAGSKIVPEFETQKPSWFDSYEMFYSVGERSAVFGDITDSVGSVLGAGMITRKSIWEHLFQSDYKFLCTDRTGNNLSTGGDIEMCAIVRKLQLKIYYSSEIYLKHFIPKERLTLSYLKRNAFGVGMFYTNIQPYLYVLSKKDVSKFIWLKDFFYNVAQLRKPLIYLLQFKGLDFIIELNVAIGKIYGLLNLRAQYLKNIEYIQSYYASRN